MMEVKCPECHSMVAAEDGSDFVVCPVCGADLDITEIEEGVTLVSLRKEEGERKKKKLVPLDDSVAEDYMKWQMAAVIAVLIGVVGILLLAMSMAQEIMQFGFYFLQQPRYAVLSSLVMLVSLGFIVGGIVLYRYVRKEITSYEDRLN